VDIEEDPIPVENLQLTRLTPAITPGQSTTMMNLVDDQGQAIPMNGQNVEVIVESRAFGGDWQEVEGLTIDWNSPPMLDVMLVADNSGSQINEALETQEALYHFTHVLTARVHPDRVGLVRVSTESVLWQEPTHLKDEMYEHIDELFVTNGWTALYDGIRLANDVLEETYTGPVGEFDPENPEYAGLGQCFSGRMPAIVAFTNGRENNSADQHETVYEGDGIDTTLEQLLDLEIGGLPTIVHTVGVGPNIDVDELTLIADSNDGKYKKIQNFGALVGALHGKAAQLKNLTPLCFEPAECHHSEVRVTVNYSQQGQDMSHTTHLDIDPTCAEPSP
jgi:hypothetical protein